MHNRPVFIRFFPDFIFSFCIISFSFFYFFF